MEATTYGCADPKCGYTLKPSTLPTNYAACPVCGSHWVADPVGVRERVKRNGGIQPMRIGGPAQFPTDERDAIPW